MLRSATYNILRNISTRPQCCSSQLSSQVPQLVASSFVVVSNAPPVTRHLQPRPMLHYQPNRGSQWSPKYIRPILDEPDLDWHKQNDTVESIPFSPVKAALLKQNVSVFRDRRLNRFIGLITKKGKRELARTMMDDTLYHIKFDRLVHQRKLKRLHKRIDTLLKAAEEAGKEDQIKRMQARKNSLDSDPPIECNPIVIFNKAIDNCTPLVETRPVKRGGALYQVPYPVTPSYAEFRAMQWMLQAVRDRPKPRVNQFPESLTRELLEAYKGEGRVVKKKETMHRNAEANKAYSHYRWG